MVQTLASPPQTDVAGPILINTNLFVGVPSSIQPDRATTPYREGQAVTNTLIPIEIRYLAEVQPGMFVITEENQWYRIDGVIDVANRHFLMELQCLALGLNGSTGNQS